MKTKKINEIADEIQPEFNEEDSIPSNDSSNLGKKKAAYKWARIDNIDEDLFAYWKNESFTREEYEKIKEQVYREG